MGSQAQSHFRAFANRLRRFRFRQLETFVSRCSCARLMRLCASAIAFPGFCQSASPLTLSPARNICFSLFLRPAHAILRKRNRISGLLPIGFAAYAFASSKHLFLAVLAPGSCDFAQAQSHFRAFATKKSFFNETPICIAVAYFNLLLI